MGRILSKTEVLRFLKSKLVMNVAVTLGEEPISSVLIFAIEDDFTFYIVTRNDTFKARALKENPRISFTIWEHGIMEVQGKGVVQEVVPSRYDEVLNKLVASAGEIEDFWLPIVSLEGGAYVVYQIKPKWLRVMDLSDIKIHEREGAYTQII